MTPEEFIQEFVQLKKQLEEGYFGQDPRTSRVKMLAEAGMDESQRALVKTIVSSVLTDALYTVLLGLDGCAAIGDRQTPFQLHDDENNLLTGDLESHAWEYFHGDQAC
ncbi:hypothetical protein IGB42_03078 [Andreprevotia sp. IGB-42]|uniref:hypothetical protein n=1 Tax=Andreprevotia sp. IGB-42 TaxID=2497473 RepID=UPI00135772F2|nr:hypothetical protein [Andreprevotia sp. IGB-42]KAF0812410.1 hypothetical protein IGB42_03078 [Andreprevotia sp. IGB-42]